MKILAKKKIQVKMMIAQNNVLFFNKKKETKVKNILNHLTRGPCYLKYDSF